MIPGLGRSPGEEIGYPLQFSWASLVAQAVKNPPVMQEFWIQSLVWEDSLEEDMATHSSILAWRISMDGGGWWATVHGVTKSRTQLSNYVRHTHSRCLELNSLYTVNTFRCYGLILSSEKSCPKGSLTQGGMFLVHFL